jgi:hypothetical protein
MKPNRPLQIQRQLQWRPAEAGRCKFKNKFKRNVNYARLKSRRPLHIQRQLQRQRQHRPAKAGRYNGKPRSGGAGFALGF